MLGQLGAVGPTRCLRRQPGSESAHIASAFDRLQSVSPQGAQLGWFYDVQMVWMRRLLQRRCARLRDQVRSCTRRNLQIRLFARPQCELLLQTNLIIKWYRSRRCVVFVYMLKGHHCSANNSMKKIHPKGMAIVLPRDEVKMCRAVEKYGLGWVFSCFSFFVHLLMNRIINISSGCMVEINCAETKGFIHYSRGVFTSKGGKTLHAVAVVGYGNVRGVDMWIVRNSWSAKWGDKVAFSCSY